MSDLMWAGTHDGVIPPPGPSVIEMSRELRAQSRQLHERYQRAYDAADAVQADTEALRQTFETARALYELRTALHPGDGNPWADWAPGEAVQGGTAESEL